MRILKKIIAVMLSLMMVLTMQPETLKVIAKTTENSSDGEVELPYYLAKDPEIGTKHIKRLKEDENEYMAIFENEDGTITVYSYASPVQYKDSNGNLIDYDSRLKEVKDDTKKNNGYKYEITSSDVSVMVPEDLVSNKYISLEKNEYKIDFKPITESDDSEKVKKDEKIKDKYKAKDIRIENENTKNNDLVGVEYLSPESDGIKYKYYVSDTGIKEDIILEEKPDTNILKFEMKLKNVIPEAKEDGNIEFKDETTGEVVGHMSPFFMYDSYKPNYETDEDEIHLSYDITVNIEEDNNNKNKYILTIYLDENMLNSEDTVYPVTVDPTLILDGSTDQYHDTYVYSGRNANYNTSAGLKTGYSSGTYRSLLKFAFPEEYDPFNITTGAMRLYNIQDTELASIDVYKATSYWHEATVSWSTQPSYDTLISSSFVGGEGYYWFGLYSVLQNWALYEISDGQAGYPNHGIVVKERNETYSQYYKEFCSEIYSVSYRRPYLEITYDQDNSKPDAVSGFGFNVAEDPAHAGKATVTFEWDPTEDNPVEEPQGVDYYELSLYLKDGTPIGGSPIQIDHDEGTTQYSYTFDNVPDETVYYGKICAYDDMSATQWIDAHKSDYSYTDPIVIGDIEEVTLSIDATDWTNDQSPTITWTGIPNTYSVEYSINQGTWTDTGYTGIAGSCDLDLSSLSQDGEYQINIRGIYIKPVPFTFALTSESSSVTYKLDVTDPTAHISYPTDNAIIGENTELVNIIGNILDDSSGIASWLLQYRNDNAPNTWITIDSGDTGIQPGETIAQWDTSGLLAGNYTLKLSCTDNVGLASADATINLSKPVSITLSAPTNVYAESDNNYMTNVSWQDGVNPADSVYEIYRGTTSDFTPDVNTNLVASVADTFYWNDFNVDTGNTYYYKVRAAYSDTNGTQYSDFATTANGIQLASPSEVGEKLGMQDFWRFSGFSAGNGAGYINVANGNLVYSATDSVFPGYMIAMVMRRTYNSQSDSKSSLGYGWDFSYNTCLYKEYDTGEGDIDLILKDGDGSLHYFDYLSTTGDISTYNAPAGIFMDLTYNAATDEYTILRNDYVKYTFDGNLNIIKLEELNGNYLHFSYNETGKLNSVQNCKPGGVSVNQCYFQYYQNDVSTGAYYTTDSAHVGLMAQMIDEAGKVYKYEYEAGYAHLVKAYIDIPGTTNDYYEEYSYISGTNNINTIKDANNHTTTISYLSGGIVSNVTYPDGKSFDVAYETNVTRTSFNGTQLTLNKTTITDSWGHITKYFCKTDGKLKIVKDTLGNLTEYDYNAEFQVVAVRYQNYVDSDTTVSTISTNIAYNANNNIQSITDAYGHATTFTYDTTFVNKVKSVTVPMSSTTNATTTNVYDANGNLARTTDAEGNVTQYTYTDHGLLETVITYVGNQTSTVGSKTQYLYYANGWLYSIKMGSKNDTELTLMSKVLEYDSQGNPTIMQDAKGNQSKVDYDILSRPVKTYLTDKDVWETTQNWSNNQYTLSGYDMKGNATSYTDISGIVTNIVYDNMDRVISTTQVVPSKSVESSIEYSNYTYNGTTCLKTIATNPIGVQSIEYYDELGRVIKTAVSDGATERLRSIMEYDKAGNLVSTKSLINYDGSSWTEVTNEYDKLNRLTKTSTVNDDGQTVRTAYTYDYAGNLITETDPANHTKSYYYDGLGRLTRVIDGYSTFYYYDNIKSYNGVNYLMNYVKDPKGHVKETYLDSYGNAVVEINQGDTTTTDKMVVVRTFNNDGTVDTITQADGQVDYYSYNKWGQTELIKYANQDQSGNQTTYEYNDHGQISLLTDRRWDPTSYSVLETQTQWTYDLLGMVASVRQDDTTMEYQFDKAGNLTKIKQPSTINEWPDVTLYTYDEYGQPESVYFNALKVTDYEYNYKGQLARQIEYIKFGQGDTTTTITAQYLYTNQNQVKDIKYVNDTTAQQMERYSYTYNNRGSILTETITNSYGGGSSMTKSYTYDELSRLTSTTIGSDVTNYTYDSTNNRYSELSRQGAVAEYYDKYFYYTEFDQLDHVTMNISNGAQTVEEYEYDDRGALTFATRRNYCYYSVIGYENGDLIGYEDGYPIYELIPIYDGGTPVIRLNTEYEYDKAGYLQKSVDETENNVFETTLHFINSLEHRVSKIVDDEKTNYIYSGSSVLFTTDENNDRITENILSQGGKVLASRRFTGAYAVGFFHYNTDIRNSTMSIIGSDYTAMKYYEYNEFGKEEEKGDTGFINEITYTGAISEGDNIYYMNARFYDANTGRFLSQDTYTGNAWEPMSQNLYTYCGNNPINYVDPTGHFSIPPDDYEAFRDFDSGSTLRDGIDGFSDAIMIKRLAELAWYDYSLDSVTNLAKNESQMVALTKGEVASYISSMGSTTLSDEELLSYYNTYSNKYGQGVYFEDISMSFTDGLGFEEGVSFVINLDQGWVAQYNHIGFAQSLSLSPIDIQVVSGQIEEGYIDTPSAYTGAFAQWNSFAGVCDAGAKGIRPSMLWSQSSRDQAILQNGIGLTTNIGASSSLSWYTKVDELVDIR